MLQLVVTSPFDTYAVGTTITDPGLIYAVLHGPNRGDVVEVNLPSGNAGPENLTLRVSVAVAFQPLSLAGQIANASPAALDYSTDNGVSWQAVGAYILSGDSWTGTGPTYGAAYDGTIQVRDRAQQSVVSAPVSFVVVASGGGGGASTGTLALGDGSVIDAIGPGLAAPQGSSPGSLSVAFGAVAGTVADGGALATEVAARQTAEGAEAAALGTESQARQAAAAAASAALTTEAQARQAGDTAGATALAAVQATASAAVPSSQRGAANGVAPLDASALLPPGNMPSIAKLPWSDAAGTAAIFHRGPVPAPAACRNGLVLADRTKLSGTYNFAEVWDTQATYDAWPALQNFLLYCQSMALSMKTSGIDNIAERNRVRAVLPRGAYLVSQPLIVPEFVELDCRGTIYRTPYTGNQSNDGVNSVAGIFATNAFLPTVVVAPRAHAREINIYVNTVGGSNLAYRGSGVCIGKTWAAQVGAACTIGNPGTGYAVNDFLS